MIFGRPVMLVGIKQNPRREEAPRRDFNELLFKILGHTSNYAHIIRIVNPRGGEEGMPLKKGKSQKVMSENIGEFHKGKTYAKTARKFGKETANKQAVAAAYSQRRRSSVKK